MTSLLVTGGTGLLGRRVTRALAADGHTVRILSRTAPGLPVPGAETVVGDLGTGAGLLRAVTGTSTIVHCATDPRRSRTVDVEGTGRLLEAGRDVKAALPLAALAHQMFLAVSGQGGGADDSQVIRAYQALNAR